MTAQAVSLPVRLRSAADRMAASADSSALTASWTEREARAHALLCEARDLLREAADNVFADVEVLTADMLALRAAYLEAAGTNATLPELVAAVRRGADVGKEVEAWQALAGKHEEAMDHVTTRAVRLDALEKAFEEATGGRTPTQQDLRDAVFRGAR